MPNIRAKELTTYHVIIDGNQAGKICEIGISPEGVFVRVHHFNRAHGRYFKMYNFKKNQLVEVKRKEVPGGRKRQLPVQRPAPVPSRPGIRRGGRNRGPSAPTPASRIRRGGRNKSG